MCAEVEMCYVAAVHRFTFSPPLAFKLWLLCTPPELSQMDQMTSQTPQMASAAGSDTMTAGLPVVTPTELADFDNSSEGHPSLPALGPMPDDQSLPTEGDFMAMDTEQRDKASDKDKGKDKGSAKDKGKDKGSAKDKGKDKGSGKDKGRDKSKTGDQSLQARIQAKAGKEGQTQSSIDSFQGDPMSQGTEKK